MISPGLRPRDLEWLATRGIEAGDAERQLALLRAPSSPLRLLRPATSGDGIEPLGEDTERTDLDAFERARAALRVERVVPASGAASRMFADLSAALERHDRGEADADGVLERFARAQDCLPFQRDLAAARERAGLEAPGEASEGAATVRLLRALLLEGPTELLERPKGLLAFHRYVEASAGSAVAEERTAFAEHLHEWATLAGGSAPLHFTVSPRHRPLFAAALEQALPAFESTLGAHPRVSWSEQDPSTDTLALEPDGDLLRDAHGRPLLRPGGHGALLRNLSARAAAGIDLLHLRNIDNVARAEDQPARVAAGRRLLGRLARLREDVFGLLEGLDRGEERAVVDAERFLVERLRRDVDTDTGAVRRERLRAALDRPLRVCGMVRNVGEPGGGPFWVETREHDGGSGSLQIVESSQVDRRDPAQDAILRSSTHFNPVDIACCVRDVRGRAFELERFVDRKTWFRSSKSQGGREIQVLERPGLWNGAMAGWLTVFVEVPAATFSPVKTVWDLLRPAHAGGTAKRG